MILMKLKEKTDDVKNADMEYIGSGKESFARDCYLDV